MAAFLFQTAKVADNSSLLLGGVAGLATARVATGVVLYAAARHESGLSAYALQSDGQVQLVQQVTSAGNRFLRGAGDMLSVQIDGNAHLVTTAFYQNTVQTYALNTGGKLFSRAPLTDDVIYDPKTDEPGIRGGGDELALFGADSVVSFSFNDQPHIIVGATYDGGMTLARLETDGSITPVSTVFDTDESHLAAVDDIAITLLNGQRFVVAVSPGEQGISVYRLGDDGSFAFASSVSTGPDIVLGRLTSVEVVETSGGTYVIVAGRGNWPVSTFRLDETGALTLTDRVTGAEAANLFDSYAMTTFTAVGKTFVAIGGDTGGISVFRLSPNGQISLVTEIDHDLPRRTNPTTDLMVEVFGDKIYIIAAGQSGDGFATYRFFPDAVGVEVQGTDSADTIRGGFKSDVLVGLDGDDIIQGKSGADTLLDGGGKDLVWGGPGRDVFEFTADGKQDKLQDFHDGFDLIDLTAAGVDRMSDMTLSQVNAKTVLISYADETLFLKGYAGQDLSAAQIGADDFIF